MGDNIITTLNFIFIITKKIKSDDKAPEISFVPLLFILFFYFQNYFNICHSLAVLCPTKINEIILDLGTLKEGGGRAEEVY